ncbi:MAG: sigma 54-interacting transcriptional regulator [Planctomycetes bacterium]|nr:sigma 54-interacting transcriptional regulator [Planctomycetota bacterium]
MSRILVIDDDPGNRLVIKSRLSDLGYEVCLTENGAEGLVEARNLGCDLFLVAAGLGAGVDAVEVTRRLRSMPETGATPIVVYSHLPASQEEMARAYDAGCDAFVPKQELPVLEHVVRVQLRAKAMLEDLSEQNRVLDQHNRRLREESQRNADRETSVSEGGESLLVLRELATSRPDGVLLVDGDGFVRSADRGACEIFGNRIEGKNLGSLAPAAGLEAFVRDARSEVRDGFRFDLQALGGRSARSLSASVIPLITKPGGGERVFKVVLLLDAGKRRIAGELLRITEPGVPRQQLGALLEAARETYGVHALAGESSGVRGAREMVDHFARKRRPVLVTGERGTGKTRVARTLHYAGPFTGPFLKLCCSALDPASLERELFGYVKGAFEDAKDDRPGLVHQAADGTLYLEELTALPAELQQKLRVMLQEGVVRRVGSERAEKVEVGVVASTSADVQAALDEGRLSRELFDLFTEHQVHLPSLIDRPEDVVPLASLFVTRYGRPRGVRLITEDAVDLLMRYEWPGNVREFEDCIRDACAAAPGAEITAACLPPALHDGGDGLMQRELKPVARPAAATNEPIPGGVPVPSASAAALRRKQPWDINDDDPISLDLYERKALLRALNHVGGDKLAAARLLKVGKSTLYRKLKRFDIT